MTSTQINMITEKLKKSFEMNNLNESLASENEQLRQRLIDIKKARDEYERNIDNEQTLHECALKSQERENEKLEKIIADNYYCQMNEKLTHELTNYLFYRQIQNVNALYEIILNSKHKSLHEQIDDLTKHLDYSSKISKSDILLIDDLKYDSSWQSASKIMVEHLTLGDTSPTTWIKTFIHQQKNIASNEISTQTETQFGKTSIGIQSNLINSNKIFTQTNAQFKNESIGIQTNLINSNEISTQTYEQIVRKNIGIQSNLLNTGDENPKHISLQYRKNNNTNGTQPVFDSSMSKTEKNQSIKHVNKMKISETQTYAEIVKQNPISTNIQTQNKNNIRQNEMDKKFNVKVNNYYDSLTSNHKTFRITTEKAQSTSNNFQNSFHHAAKHDNNNNLKRVPFNSIENNFQKNMSNRKSANFTLTKLAGHSSKNVQNYGEKSRKRASYQHSQNYKYNENFFEPSTRRQHQTTEPSTGGHRTENKNGLIFRQNTCYNMNPNYKNKENESKQKDDRYLNRDLQLILSSLFNLLKSYAVKNCYVRPKSNVYYYTHDFENFKYKQRNRSNKIII